MKILISWIDGYKARHSRSPVWGHAACTEQMIFTLSVIKTTCISNRSYDIAGPFLNMGAKDTPATGRPNPTSVAPFKTKIM